MKPCISLLLIITILLVFLTGCQSGTETSTSSEPIQESPASDFKYKTVENGIEIAFYIGSDAHVVIPAAIEGKPVVKVGASAFHERTFLVSVSFPDTVTYIGMHAFEDCTSLTTVNLPEALQTIEGSAFLGCSALSDIALPSTLTHMGQYAFKNCSSLKHITIPKTIAYWGVETFSYSGIETVVFEHGLDEIADVAFFKTKVTEIVLPPTITYIGYNAFGQCSFLESVQLNEGVVRIGDRAFSGTAIREIVLPASVETVTELSFDLCNALKAVHFEGDAPDRFIYEMTKASTSNYTVYYHEGAEGFTSPEWNGYKTAIW